MDLPAKPSLNPCHLSIRPRRPITGARCHVHSPKSEACFAFAHTPQQSHPIIPPAAYFSPQCVHLAPRPLSPVIRPRAAEWSAPPKWNSTRFVSTPTRFASTKTLPPVQTSNRARGKCEPWFAFENRSDRLPANATHVSLLKTGPTGPAGGSNRPDWADHPAGHPAGGRPVRSGITPARHCEYSPSASWRKLARPLVLPASTPTRASAESRRTSCGTNRTDRCRTGCRQARLSSRATKFVRAPYRRYKP